MRLADLVEQMVVERFAPTGAHRPVVPNYLLAVATGGPDDEVTQARRRHVLLESLPDEPVVDAEEAV